MVLFESGILRYFVLTKNMEDITANSERAADPKKSQWVYDSVQKPCGKMNLQPH